MKKLVSLWSFFCLLAFFPAHSQDIFQENGLYGIKYDGQVRVPALHTQIIELIDGSFLLIRKNPAVATGGFTLHTPEETAGLYDSRADTVGAFPFKKELLYGYVTQFDYVPANFQALYFRYIGDDVQVFDGKTYRWITGDSEKLRRLWSEERIIHVNKEFHSDLIFKQKGKYGLATSYFSVRLKPKYTLIKQADGSYSRIILADAKGQYLIGAEGGFCWKKPFQEIKVLGDDGTAAVKQNGLWGFLAMYGEDFYMQPQFEEVMPAATAEETSNYAMVRKNGKWGIYAVGDDSLALPAEYDSISYKGEGVFALVKNGATTEWKQ